MPTEEIILCPDCPPQQATAVMNFDCCYNMLCCDNFLVRMDYWIIIIYLLMVEHMYLIS